jgi:hypothetical protein
LTKWSDKDWSLRSLYAIPTARTHCNFLLIKKFGLQTTVPFQCEGEKRIRREGNYSPVPVYGTWYRAYIRMVWQRDDVRGCFHCGYDLWLVTCERDNHRLTVSLIWAEASINEMGNGRCKTVNKNKWCDAY